MTEKNNIQPNGDGNDEFIRQLMQSSKIQAPENLKHRVMRQIETEHALTRKKSPVPKARPNVLKDFIGVFGVMYAVLAVVAGGAYFLYGKDFLLTPQFLGTVALIASVFSLFWLMTRVDAVVRGRRMRKK